MVAGLINKDHFLSQLATNYGLSIYSRRPIRLLLDTAPLQLDYQTSIDTAIEKAMQRNSAQVYDSVIISQNNQYYGTATIKDLLEISREIELNRAKDSNPLTNLPGNKRIEAEFQQYKMQNMEFTAIYIDLDNFKAYNDTYGFAAGDQVLLATAKILLQCTQTLFEKSFIGHIGGDDFIIFVPTLQPQALCTYILETFSNSIKKYYNAEHRAQGYIIARNRQDELCKMPLMTLSLAVLLVDFSAETVLETLSHKAAHIKKQCKKDWKNNFIIESIA